jgi:hypothetical protein
MNNRVLKRPMFKMGGSSNEGITSGLDRVGYADGPTKEGIKEDVTSAALKVMMQGKFPNMSDAELNTMITNSQALKGNELAQERMLGMDYNIDATNAMLEKLPEYMKKQEPKEMPNNDFSRFMINFGLNLGTQEPRGNILTTALAAAQGPTKEYFERQDARDLMERQDEANERQRQSDLFKTMLSSNVNLSKAKYDAITAKDKDPEIIEVFSKSANDGRGGTVFVTLEDLIKDMETTKDFIPTPKTESGDTPAKIKVANDVVQTTSDIIAKKAQIEKAKNDPQFTGDLKQLETDLQLLQTRISTLTKTDPIALAILNDPIEVQRILRAIKAQLMKENPTKYQGEEDINLLQDAKTEFEAFFGLQQMAEGGRAGYQMGGGADMDQMPEDQNAPKIDFDTLRARLPKEITDDIVRLIAASPEAFEDFAVIQTQQDVDLFNQKYNVELVLPAEA